MNHVRPEFPLTDFFSLCGQTGRPLNAHRYTVSVAAHKNGCPLRRSRNECPNGPWPGTRRS
eukprot:3797817-Prymnesium_polylepis.1